MPTYEYRCPTGHEFELFQSMSEEPSAECPECGEVAERLLSGGAGLIFKGEGFYITDYRSDAYKKAASSEKKAASSEKEGAASSDKGSGKSKGDSSSPSKAPSASHSSSKESSPSSGSATSSSSDD